MIGGIISGIGSIISSGLNAASARRQQEKQIAADREMNERNIAFQRETNQQNIDFQREINDIMRRDNRTAIQTKKSDLINAGYSTADPNLQGASVASLGAPNIQSPQVASEFNPAMSQQLLDAGSHFSDSIINTARTLSDIALNKAHVKESNANATGKEIENAWSDAEHAAQYDTTLQTLENLKKDSKIKDEEYNKLVADINSVNESIKLTREQVELAKTENKFKPSILQNTSDHLAALIDNLDSATDLNKTEKSIKNFEKRIKSVEANFAELGINFNGSSYVDALLRAAASPRGKEIIPLVASFIKDSLSGIFSNIIPSKDEFVKGSKKFIKGAGKTMLNILSTNPLFGGFSSIIKSLNSSSK